MFLKIVTCCLAVLVVLWAAGFNFRAVKDDLTGFADSNASSMTGPGDDWG
jgi:hypothetical protein